MTGARRAVGLVLTGLVVAGCGGGGEGQEAKDALERWFSSAETGNAERVCEGMTPESRRMVDVLGRGREGPDGSCAGALDDRLERLGSGGLSQEQIRALDAADVDVEGDTARVEDDDEEVTMRKVGGKWLVDFESVPDVGYGLTASALCTETNLRALRRPLPAATRRGMAAAAEQERKDLERLVRTLEEEGAPEGKEDAHATIVRLLRVSARDWRRAASAMRGFGEPISTYNRAMKAIYRRGRSLLAAQEELGVSCLGTAGTRADAREYLRASNRICRATLRRLDRTRPVDVAQALPRIGRATARALKRVEAPEGFGPLHRRSADAMAAAYAQAPRVVSAGGAGPAQEKFELGLLRGGIGFLHLGLAACAQL